jgi:hypothetical protein
MNGQPDSPLTGTDKKRVPKTMRTALGSIAPAAPRGLLHCEAIVK